MAKLHLLKLKNWPIFKQLQLEEALFRTGSKNFCIINQGSPPACVLGISARLQDVIDNNDHFPIIRRFSGGGNVIIDENTIFISFIIQKEDVNTPPFPKKILSWTENIYAPVFKNLDFKILDNDYVLGEKKFGGNAQSINKTGWLHHTSLLWDFDDNKMDLLKMPAKTPQYRQKRAHRDFLCRLKDHFQNQKSLFDKFFLSLSNHFTLLDISENDVSASLNLPHRKTTKFLSIQNSNSSI